ncbi:MAG: SRPBCC family protein [Acidimicrobiia bacterium]
MADFAESITIDRDPDVVWNVVGDLENISGWLPFITESRLDGPTTRVCRAGEHGELRERIVSHDATARRYEYTITSAPMPIDDILATIAVLPHGDGARVIWHTTVEPEGLVDMFKPIYAEGLSNLKTQLEA